MVRVLFHFIYAHTFTLATNQIICLLVGFNIQYVKATEIRYKVLGKFYAFLKADKMVGVIFSVDRTDVSEAIFSEFFMHHMCS